MKIPKNTVSASQLRTYGAGGFKLEQHESEKGCPRKYKAKYVDGVKEEGPKPYPLRYGGLFHTVLFLMVEKGLTPDEALSEAWEVDMPQEMWTEARADLEKYMERGASPMDTYATLEVEAELRALLYTDEVYGDIYMRGFLDWIGIDWEIPDLVHSVDYKTNRNPARTDDLVGDVQLRGYDWLIRQNWQALNLPRRPRVVTHLDVVKFNEVQIAYTDAEIEDWHSWAVAVVRKILRDEDALPILNDGCGYCFVKDSCPAYSALPEIAEGLVEEGAELKDPVAKLAWRDKAHKIRGLLDKAVKGLDAGYKADALKQGRLEIGSTAYVSTPKFVNDIDLPKLKELLGDNKFFEAVTTSKAAIERATKDLDPSTQALALATIGRKMDGSEVKRIDN
ncbi:RecB-like exonuclease [Arthrobacter phage KellEzio]|uniref:RecB-like exonuclease n=1 Tax=Arthrobacter phage KellEzio TaxID=1796995 RepID=A0A140G6F7_9CAUD|nr:RecB-like exonuclease [Arthrobacter phage KellEzio]AMM44242.1 RecB-like exonuclease [Arthrobacter phage KellEzio]